MRLFILLSFFSFAKGSEAVNEHGNYELNLVEDFSNGGRLIGCSFEI